MKILYIANIRLPTEKAHGLQIMKTCEALARKGIQVELVVPGRKTHIQESAFEYYDVEDNFTITKLGTPDWVGIKISTILSQTLFSLAVFFRKSFWKANVIYSRDAGVLLWYLLLGRKLVYEAHTKPTRISLFVAKRVPALIVISGGLQDAYSSLGISKKKITIAHDAIDPGPFQNDYDQKEARAWLGIPQDKKVALYVGKIDEAKGAYTFAASSEHLPEEIIVVLIGPESPLKDSLKIMYPKALFLPEMPYKELPRVLAIGDILVLPNSAKDEDASKYTSPLKAFAYMATGKPIIASGVSALREILENKAVFFIPDDAWSLSQKIIIQPKIKFAYEQHTWNDRAETIQASIASL